MAATWRYPAYANRQGHFDTKVAVEAALTRHDAGRDEIVEMLARLIDVLHEADVLRDDQVETMLGHMFVIAE